jgi:hypothetical protein
MAVLQNEGMVPSAGTYVRSALSRGVTPPSYVRARRELCDFEGLPMVGRRRTSRSVEVAPLFPFLPEFSDEAIALGRRELQKIRELGRR